MEKTENKKLIPLRLLAAKNGGPIEVSLPHLYQLAKKGEIVSIRLGRSVLVPSWYVDKLISTGQDDFSPKQ